MKLANLPSSSGSLAMYMSEISQFPLLTQEEEQRLARVYRKSGTLRAGHVLVTSNLRFVMKVAYEYRSYGLKMSDLIQEGNLGLIKAVEKFDPNKDIRLISYAVWWIRAYIQNYILKNWSLVKLGTTQAQRKLFFSLARTKRELEKLSASSGQVVEASEIARRLKVKTTEVQEMEQRLDGRDLSLDAPMGDDGGNSHVDFVAGHEAPQDEAFSTKEERELVTSKVELALMRLDPRERFIIEKRAMSDAPMSLKEIGEHFGFSRERARQLELRAKEKLRQELSQLADDLGLAGEGAPGEA
jgi:RNA polymerase sigma-32 factor